MYENHWKLKEKKNELNKFRTCLTVEDNEVIATPVGLVHSKDFVRNVFVGKFKEALGVTIFPLDFRPSIPWPNKRFEGMLGWIDNWEVSL